ncbi:MAG: hypothetical protein ACR2IY_05515, partial [Rubrivivax sp.]
MFYTCLPHCSDPTHQHRPFSALATKGGPAASARPIVRNRRGKSLVVDLHCHYLNPKVNAKT